MEYPFWVNDFDRIKNYRDSYPLASEIFEQPQSFWYGDNPKKPKKHMEKILIISTLPRNGKPNFTILKSGLSYSKNQEQNTWL